MVIKECNKTQVSEEKKGLGEENVPHTYKIKSKVHFVLIKRWRSSFVPRGERKSNGLNN